MIANQVLAGDQLYLGQTLTEKGKKILEVYNTGQGIPINEQNRIFERFYRIDKARNSSSKSYGLGLSIAKAIIEDHHGKINVHSDLGKWVKFQVYL